MKRYDSMGFESEHGIWVRAVDADELAAALREIVQEGVIYACHHRGVAM